MKKEIIEDINRVSRLNGDFTLRSGLKSDTYFDKYQFQADPKLIDIITTEMVKLIPKETDVLAGLEMGGIPLVTLLGQKMKLPIAFIRKEAKAYGTCKYAEGVDLCNKKVVLIEDIVSSGGALIDALDKLQNDNVNIISAVCVIDRESGGTENLAKKGIQLQSLLKFSDFETLKNQE